MKKSERIHRWILLCVVAVTVLNSRLEAQVRVGPQKGFHLDKYVGKATDSLSRAGPEVRLYFLQQSNDLILWVDLAVIVTGADRMVRCDLNSPGRSGFVRLENSARHTRADDFDGDGISDDEELQQGTNPFSAALDTNELPSDWEKFYGVPPGIDPLALSPRTGGLTYLQAFEEGIDPVGYHHEQLPTLTVTGDKQKGPPGRFAPEPLVVQATDAGGLPMADVPILFQTNEGLLQTSCSAESAPTLFVRTDKDGQAQVFCQLPDRNDAACTVAASTTYNGRSAHAAFTVASGDGRGTYSDPFAPTDFVSQGNPDGSVDMSWENHSYDETPVEIEFQQADGSWRLVVTLPTETTSYHFPGSQ